MKLTEVTVVQLTGKRGATYISWPWSKNPDVDGNLYQEILEWCTEQFGPPGGKKYRWMEILMIGSLEFRDEKDAMLFLLKWA